MPNPKTPNGAPRAWIETHRYFTGDECLIWPFKRDRDGYGQLRVNGTDTTAARVMCQLRHGPPPTPRHESAHSCGKGHLGCVNGGHLRWATHAENMADSVLHGTRARGERNGNAKLTDTDVLAIRASGASRQALAQQFGVSQTHIDNIINKSRWAWLANPTEPPPRRRSQQHDSRRRITMAQGEFTKDEVARMIEAVNELFEAIPKSKRMEFLGHLNDICLFLEAAKRAAKG